MVSGVWSERRSRAWRRGLMLPIWQVMIRICPLQCHISLAFEPLFPGSGAGCQTKGGNMSFHLENSDFLALPTCPTLPPFSARPAGSNSSAGLKQQQDGQQQDGRALQYCSRELQKDPKISTIAAVRRNGQALKDVPEEMKRDRLPRTGRLSSGPRRR